MTNAEHKQELAEIDPEKVLKTTMGDALAVVSQVGLGAFLAHAGLPAGTDAVAVALMGAFTRPLLSRRYAKFGRDVFERLARLEEQYADFTVAALAEDEQFIDVLTEAARAATSTHSEAKLAALRNAVLNTAKGASISDDEQMWFLSVVESLTPTHLRLLKFLESMPQYMVDHHVPHIPSAGNTFDEVIEHGMPDMAGRAAMFHQFCQELYARGFVIFDLGSHPEGPIGVSAGHTTPVLRSYVSDLGRVFLAYISSPLGDV